MVNLTKDIRKDHGFTIVELLVVIVVIGILAAITIIAYTGISARANTSGAQSEANSAIAKMNVYAIDTAYNIPTSYGSISGAASTTSYYASGLNFTTASGPGTGNGVVMTTKPATNDSIDFSLCGTNGTSTAPTAYSGITVPSGVKIGYWDQVASSLNTSNTIGTTSGNYLTFPVACFKVGLAEATMAVVRAMYNENSSTWPTSAAAIQANTAASAKLPPTLATISGVVAGSTLNSGNALTAVDYNCKTGGCTGGGRIMFWDVSAGALSTAATSLYFGGATSADTFVAAP